MSTFSTENSRDLKRVNRGTEMEQDEIPFMFDCIKMNPAIMHNYNALIKAYKKSKWREKKHCKS